MCINYLQYLIWFLIAHDACLMCPILLFRMAYFHHWVGFDYNLSRLISGFMASATLLCNISSARLPYNISSARLPGNVSSVTLPCNIASATLPSNIASATLPCIIYKYRWQRWEIFVFGGIQLWYMSLKSVVGFLNILQLWSCWFNSSHWWHGCVNSCRGIRFEKAFAAIF